MKDIGDYSDIIEREHYTSKTRPRMSALERAAQFSPFAALKGFEEEIDEAARPKTEAPEPDEFRAELLNEKLKLLAQREGERPTVRVVYFRERGDGFEEAVACGRLLKIDGVFEKLILEGEIIPFAKIKDLSSD